MKHYIILIFFMVLFSSISYSSHCDGNAQHFNIRQDGRDNGVCVEFDIEDKDNEVFIGNEIRVPVLLSITDVISNGKALRLDFLSMNVRTPSGVYHTDRTEDCHFERFSVGSDGRSVRCEFRLVANSEKTVDSLRRTGNSQVGSFRQSGV